MAMILPLAACYEVENGPAFSDGDHVPGLEGAFEPIGRIEPGEEGLIPHENDEDLPVYMVRRALNGSYVMQEVEADNDEYVLMTMRRIDRTTFVIEHFGGIDENMLGIGVVDGRGEDRTFSFCIDVEMEMQDQQAIAARNDVTLTPARFGADRLAAENGHDLFSFMRDLWQESEMEDWTCTVLAKLG